MKNAQVVASKVDSSGFNRRTEPGKAQGIILNALGVEAESFGHAEAIFEAFGISVIAVRQGRRSVPEVRRTTVGGYGYNAYGEMDGDFYNPADGIDLSAISEWMVK